MENSPISKTAYFACAVDYARDSIKYLFAANGGGLLAAIALRIALGSNQEILLGQASFAFGVLASILCAFCGFFSHGAWLNDRKSGHAWEWAGVALAIIALALFFCGCEALI